MSFRIEEKLYIKFEHLIDFKKYLNKHSAKQLYDPRSIKSLYFENKNYDMFNDSIEGLAPRKKIRIRTYPQTDDDKIYLETKISSVEGRFKIRKIIDNEKSNYLENYGILDSQYGLCKPCLYVIYQREYFKIKDVRISIDKNITYQTHKSRRLIKDKNGIIEIKASIKKNIDELVNDFPFQRIRFSKYCNGIERTT